MRRPEQSPSIVPPGNDRDVYLVLDDFRFTPESGLKSDIVWGPVGSKPEKLNASTCFPLFTQQRTSPRYFGMSVSCLINGHDSVAAGGLLSLLADIKKPVGWLRGLVADAGQGAGGDFRRSSKNDPSKNIPDIMAGIQAASWLNGLWNSLMVPIAKATPIPKQKIAKKVFTDCSNKWCAQDSFF